MRYFTFLLFILLTSCAALPTPSSTLTSFDSMVITRQLLVRGENSLIEIDKSRRAGVVLFSRDAKKKRRTRVCDIYRVLPTTGGAVASGILAEQIAPTFWPVVSRPADIFDCNQLLDRYDYDTAAILLQRLQLTSVAGPVLATHVDGKVAYIDLSRAKKTHIRALVPEWANAIQANNGEPIRINGGFPSDVCEAAGINTQRVTVGVLEIIDNASQPSFFEGLRDMVGGAILGLLPIPPQVTDGVRKTCERA